MMLRSRLTELGAGAAAVLCAACSYDISTIASVIPAFASRQDLLVIDDGVSYPIQQVCLGSCHSYKSMSAATQHACSSVPSARWCSTVCAADVVVACAGCQAEQGACALLQAQ
jgi:hypothetical protein